MKGAGIKKIAIFSWAYEPLVGGAELAVKEITRRLSYSWDCFTYRFDSSWGTEEKIGSVRVFRLGKGARNFSNKRVSIINKTYYIFKAWRAAEIVHRLEPFNGIWAVMASYGGFSALLFKLRHPKVPLLLTLQEGDSEEHILGRVGIFYPLWQLIFKKADYIQAISNSLADFAKRHGAKCEIQVVPNGADINKFKSQTFPPKADPPRAENLKSRESKKQKVIITTSRLVYKNGIDVLIRACAKLPFTDYKLLILGDGPERKKLMALAKNLKIGEKIIFLGHVDPESIPRYLAKADIFVRPSRSEGLGSSFLEAMAAGLPVIGTRVGGIPEFLRDGETGIFSEVDDPEDLSVKIRELLESDKLANKLSVNGQDLVKRNFSWDVLERAFEIFFKKLLASKTKIVIATGLFPPDIGGPATYSKLLLDALPKDSFEVKVLSFSDVRKLPKIARHIVYFFKIFRAAKNTDLIFAQDPVSVGLPALMAAKLLGVKFYLKIVGDYAWEQSVQRYGITEALDDFLDKRYGVRVELLRFLENLVARGAAKIAVPSFYLKKVVYRWGIGEEKIFVIYNAFDKPWRSLSRNDKKTSFTIFSAGRLVPWKGFELLISLGKELRVKIPELKILIAGSGPEKPKLESLISKYRLQTKVVLLGLLSREEIFAYLKSANVFALNTAYEGFSHLILEAMSLGVPVITTDVGGNPELIKDRESGFLVRFNDQQSFREAVIELWNRPLLAERLGSWGKKAAAQFTTERLIKDTIKFLEL